MKSLSIYFLCTLSIGGHASRAQTKPAGSSTSGGQGVLNQARGSLPGGAATQITVHFNNLVDSSRPGQMSAVVKSPATFGNTQIPAGAPAAVRLVVAGAGNPRMWTLSLTSVNVNGQMVAVNGTSPSFDAVGTVMGGAVSKAGSVLGSALGGRQQPKQQPKQPATQTVTPSTSGQRVYVPAGSDVRFAVAAPATMQANNATQQGGGVVQDPGAAPATNPGQQVQPNAMGQQQPVQNPGGTVAPGQQGTPGASSSTVVYENIQYQLQGCQRQAPHIICNIQVTNLGANDAFPFGGNETYYIDQAGNRVGATARKFANCEGWGRCQLLPGVAVAGRFEFVDTDGRATQLVRLQIHQNRKPVAQFQMVPVQ
jgi:hypothetical protein